MTDRIAELRALIEAERESDQLRGPGKRREFDAWMRAHARSKSALHANADALLACAEALHEIIEPISYMKRRLQDGERLNGVAALQLANDVEYLRGIARTAIARLNGDDHD